IWIFESKTPDPRLRGDDGACGDDGKTSVAAPGARTSLAWCARPAVARRRGAGDLARARGLVHVQRHLALELEFALDHRVRADDDPRLALVHLHREPVRGRLGDG